MTGPEHYREAAALLNVAAQVPAKNDDSNPHADRLIALAQAHASLAVAAAIATNPAGPDFIPDRAWDEYAAWAEVCAVTKPEPEATA